MPNLQNLPTSRPLNPSFSTANPNLQIAWDSTSLGAFKTCPRYYQLSIVEGWQPRRLSVHLVFGLHYHSALELYDREKAKGRTHEAAQLTALRHVLEVSWDKTLNRPWLSDDPNKNRETLVRSVVWYLEQFADDPLETMQLADGRPAVELSFKFQTDYASFQGESFWLCGHLDRIALHNEEFFVVDRKTSKSLIDQSFFEKFSPDNQMATYGFAAKIVYATPISGIIIDAAQVAVTFTRFLRGPVALSSDQLDEWYAGLRWVFHNAELYAHYGDWPMNEKSCGNYGGCQFRSICSKPKSVRQTWLSASFVHRQWDPLTNRGDI